MGAKPSIQACTLAGNQTHDLLAYGTALQPAEPSLNVFLRDHISQSKKKYVSISTLGKLKHDQTALWGENCVDSVCVRQAWSQ